MFDAPDAHEILDAVTGFLRADILPLLEGAAAFQLRVAANALDLVRREIAVTTDDEARDREALQALLATDGDVSSLTQELARRIRDRSMDRTTPGLEDYLWASTEAKLAVDQPHYAGLRRAKALRTAHQTES